MSLRVIGYARVSTEEQAASGAGIAAQQAAIEAECDRRGWELDRIAVDTGSGKSTAGRPELGQALADLDAGRADGLVAAKIDRLARSTLDFATIMGRAQRRGWSLTCLDVQVDTTTPVGEMMASVVAAFAQYERRLIGQRTKAGLAAKRAAGVRLGRPVSLPGPVRERIVAERAGGRSFAKIADGLNADEVATAQGGAAWYPATVRAALQSVAADQAHVEVLAGVG